jgi:hypothetical protein
MNRIAKTLAILVTLLVLGYNCNTLSAQEGPETKTSKTPSASTPEKGNNNFYRIQFMVNELQDGKKINSRKFTMDTSEVGRAAAKIGSRVPVPISNSTQFQYIDIALDITCLVRQREGRLGMQTTFDMSSLGDSGQDGKTATPGGPIVRHLSSETDTAVFLGKPTVIATIDDLTIANHQYVLEATVTKLTP